MKEKHIHIHSWIYCALVELEGNKKTNVLATCEGEGREGGFVRREKQHFM